MQTQRVTYYFNTVQHINITLFIIYDKNVTKNDMFLRIFVSRRKIWDIA